MLKINGKNNIASPSVGSPQSVGNSSDLDKNVPVKDTELDFRLSHSNKGKSSTIETENLSRHVTPAKILPTRKSLNLVHNLVRQKQIGLKALEP